MVLGAAVTLWATSCAPPEGRRGWQCIAPANAGGGWDLTCRLTSEVFSSLGLSPGRVRTVNVPGAGGGIAFAEAVGRYASDPDVLVAASPATTLRLAQRQFGPLEVSDVRWVGAVGAEYGIVAVAHDAPWSDLGAFLRAWRDDPGAVVVSGGSPVAGQDHMKMLLLARAGGVAPRAVRYVPFDGGGEAMTALLGGFVDVFAGEASEIESQLESGQLRLLAVLAPERLSGTLSAVPTAREAGYDVDWVTWRGFYVPPDIGDAAYAEWVRRLAQVVDAPEWSAVEERARLRPFRLTGEAFESFVYAQVEEFRALARELGLIE